MAPPKDHAPKDEAKADAQIPAEDAPTEEKKPEAPSRDASGCRREEEKRRKRSQRHRTRSKEEAAPEPPILRCTEGAKDADANSEDPEYWEMGESTEEELDAIPDAEERYRRRKRYEEVNRSGRRKLRRKLTPMSTDQ